MSLRRTINKYPNRRLYDPSQGRYITLDDIRKLVTEHVEFIVIDKKSGADITCAVLVQVVSAEEKGVQGLLRRDFLLDLIRSSSGPDHGAVGAYLEQALALFVEHAAALQQPAEVADTAVNAKAVNNSTATAVSVAVL